MIEECCEALSQLFAADVSLRHSAYGARAIAAIVNEKKCDVSPKLLSTFLRMNIKVSIPMRYKRIYRFSFSVFFFF